MYAVGTVAASDRRCSTVVTRERTAPLRGGGGGGGGGRVSVLALRDRLRHGRGGLSCPMRNVATTAIGRRPERSDASRAFSSCDLRASSARRATSSLALAASSSAARLAESADSAACTARFAASASPSVDSRKPSARISSLRSAAHAASATASADAAVSAAPSPTPAPRRAVTPRTSRGAPRVCARVRGRSDVEGAALALGGGALVAAAVGGAATSVSSSSASSHPSRLRLPKILRSCHTLAARAALLGLVVARVPERVPRRPGHDRPQRLDPLGALLARVLHHVVREVQEAELALGRGGAELALPRGGEDLGALAVEHAPVRERLDALRRGREPGELVTNALAI